MSRPLRRVGRVTPLVAACVMAMQAPVARAASDFWTCTGSNAWENTACWSTGALPTSSDYASLAIDAPSSIDINISATTPPITVNVLSIGTTKPTSTMQLTQSAGSMQSAYEYLGGVGKTDHTQYGGTNATSVLYVIGDAGSQSTYTLWGGTLTASQTYLQSLGSASFVNNGGTHTGALLTIGGYTGSGGQYFLGGGTSSFDGSVSIGDAATGVLAQTGGSFHATQEYVGSFGQVQIAGSTHTVDATLTLDTGSRLTMASGGLSAGGLVNRGTFEASGGTIYASVQNHGSMELGANVYLAFTGSASQNFSSLALRGGSTNLGADFSNTGVLSGFGLVQSSGPFRFDNIGDWQVTGGIFKLASTGPNWNSGTLSVASTSQLQLYPSTTLTNAGSAVLNGGQITGDGQFVNAAGGTLTGKGTISSGFANAGYLGIGAGTLNVTRSFENTGLIDLTHSAASLNGGTITNRGTLQGWGNVANAVANSGTVEAIGGTLVLASAGSSNDGTLSAHAGAKLLFTNGLAANAGLIALDGGTFDNGGKALSNGPAGSITGAGTLRTGGLTNTGAVNLSFGASTVLGAVDNQAGGRLVVSNGAQATFVNGVHNNGELRVSEGGAANFFGLVSGSGTFGGTGQTRFEGGFAPGNSPAVVTVDFKASYGSGSTIEMELGGTTPGNCNSCSDKIIFNNAVVLEGGKLQVVWWNDHAGAAGNVYDLFDWNGSLTGSFGQLLLPTLANGLAWDTSHLYTSGEISVTAVPEPRTTMLWLAGLAVMARLRQRRRPSA